MHIREAQKHTNPDPELWFLFEADLEQNFHVDLPDPDWHQGLRIRISSMRMRIQLSTSMLIRIRILLLIKGIGPPRLCFEPQASEF
jgi:hypothetical protein